MQHKKLIAAMVAAGLSMPALAVADITIYGRAHLSVDLLDDGADYSEVNISSNSSRLGFKGERQFTPELTAIFQIEQEIQFDSSESNETFTTRDTFAGLKGDWGMLRIGRFDTSFKRARDPANFFGDQVGDLRNIARTSDHGRFDERFRNALHYRSPSLNGFVWDLDFSTDHRNQTTAEGSDNRAFSTSLNYKNGPFTGAVAFERQNIENSPNPEAWRLAAAYRITPEFTLAGFYQKSESAAENEGTVVGVAGQYRLSPSMYLNAHYFALDSDLTDKDANLFALGLEYRVDRALRFYGNFAMMDNDDASALTPWSQARTSGPGGVAGETAKAFSLGMRYDF
ncbi:porin [Ectothiorhodospira shaposhnikovii]|uniref:porin n=1 Tax=Ectothiorhodospira shaposhnikovii TaxID=1054 RepID=UPI001EE8C66A|nr:porin [Ectothiorhodospira shaposhnikovii]MCG5511588.1 porin [Ectothiorhodospira shaposhnikovii]